MCALLAVIGEALDNIDDSVNTVGGVSSCWVYHLTRRVNRVSCRWGAVFGCRGVAGAFAALSCPAVTWGILSQGVGAGVCWGSVLVL